MRRQEERRSQIGTGDRSEKIRTYNFPQGRVTDHRIKLTLYKIDAIMDGDLQELIDSLIAADQGGEACEDERELRDKKTFLRQDHFIKISVSKGLLLFLRENDFLPPPALIPAD